jgi:hypothetical protein
MGLQFGRQEEVNVKFAERSFLKYTTDPGSPEVWTKTHIPPGCIEQTT